MTVDLYDVLHQSSELLLFIILGAGLALGKVNFGPVRLGSTIGVLLAALAFGKMGFYLPQDIQKTGFMLFIFCVGIEAGPYFFSVFLRDSKLYVSLALCLTLTAVGITLAIANVYHLDKGITAGILAGSLTSTPALVGAQDALRATIAPQTLQHVASLQNNLSISYALSYLVSLISLMLLIRFIARFLRLDLPKEALTIARERGLVDGEGGRKVYLPIIRGYRVGPDLEQSFAGSNLREVGIYRRTGCYVERIRRNGILAEPDGDAVLKEGDEIALLGYAEDHARIDPLFRSGNEVFDRDLLDLQIVTEEIVVKNDQLVGKYLSSINITEHGCFLNRITRAQIEMPIEKDIMLNKGDLLQISGEKRRVRYLADKIGFVSIHSKITDLMAFSIFFSLGLLLGKISFIFGSYTFTVGNVAGLLFSGILMGYIRTVHPTIGNVPPAALKVLKNLGLSVFMVGIGLNAGRGLVSSLSESGLIILGAGIVVGILPVIVCYLFGRFVLKMNPALLLGAITGARTCAPAMETLNELSRSNVPSLGYVGTYALANVLFTIAGSFITGFL